MIDNYTQILEASAEQSDRERADSALTKLIDHLKSAGKINSLPQIVRELHKVSAKRLALMPRVEVASENEMAEALESAEAEGVKTSVAIINPSLIRGWRAMNNGVLIDRSAKSKLINLYQKVIS